jgi:hypothetical protein
MAGKTAREAKSSPRKRTLAIKKESLKDLTTPGRGVKGGTLLYQAPTRACINSGGASASYPYSYSR